MPKKKFIVCIVCDANKEVDGSRHFYSFPSDNTIKEQWVKFCSFHGVMRNTDISSITKDTYLCSKHFKTNDIGKKKLKYGAIPSIYKTKRPREVSVAEEISDNEYEETTSIPIVEYKLVATNDMDNIQNSKAMSSTATLKIKNMKIKQLQQQNYRLRKKVENIDDLMTTLKQNNLHSEDAVNRLISKKKLGNTTESLGENSSPKTGIICDEFDVVAVNVRDKLRRMDQLQRILAESLICKVLTMGMLKELSWSTDID